MLFVAGVSEIPKMHSGQYLAWTQELVKQEYRSEASLPWAVAATGADLWHDVSILGSIMHMLPRAAFP